jgi:hypothetical protein
MIFFHIGWMKYYEGIDHKRDPIWFPKKADHERELEQYNFKSIRGFTYGDVRVKGINITKLGAEPNQEHIEGVTIIFMANRPPNDNKDDNKTVVVGWYDNATLYRRHQYRTNEISYFAKTRTENAHIVEEKDRSCCIPRIYGQSNIWYCDKETKDYVDTRNNVIEYINKIKNQLTNKDYPDGVDGPHDRGSSTSKVEYLRLLSDSEQIIKPHHHRLQSSYIEYLKNEVKVHTDKLHQNDNYVDVDYYHDGHFVLVEVKPASIIGTKYAIRQAVGQLLEYRYVSGRQKPEILNAELHIVLDKMPEQNEIDYVKSLKFQAAPGFTIVCKTKGKFIVIK